MTVYSFDRLSVLLVEDCPFVRDLLEQVLRQLGFGWVAKASNGQEAIEFLELVNRNPNAAGIMSVDLIVSDLVMSPINGLLLLQWVRNHPNSPNRMIPFLLISGAADKKHVHAARDAGVTEFCAKPFSAASVAQKILEIIDHPRQIVASGDYFGPDRRRRRVAVPKDIPDRRRADDKHATIVYSTEKVQKRKKADVWFFRLNNALKSKVGGGGSREPGTLPKNILDLAEKELEHTALDFADWAMSYISKLGQLSTDALMKPTLRKTLFEEMNLVAHELRGQGGTFGYPLITVFAKSLHEATESGAPLDDPAVEVVKAHVDAMRAVIRERVKGDGGEIGQALLKGLEQAKEQRMKKVGPDAVVE